MNSDAYEFARLQSYGNISIWQRNMLLTYMQYIQSPTIQTLNAYVGVLRDAGDTVYMVSTYGPRRGELYELVSVDAVIRHTDDGEAYVVFTLEDSMEEYDDDTSLLYVPFVEIPDDLSLEAMEYDETSMIIYESDDGEDEHILQPPPDQQVFFEPRVARQRVGRVDYDDPNDYDDYESWQRQVMDWVFSNGFNTLRAYDTQRFGLDTNDMDSVWDRWYDIYELAREVGWTMAEEQVRRMRRN